MLYVFANWKMYLTCDEAIELAAHVSHASVPQSITVGVFPSMLSLKHVVELCKDTDISVGVQYAYWVENGAYTGAESFAHVAGAGARYALIGHSERRHVFHEHSDQLKKEFTAAVDAGMCPVLCVGETLEQRESGKAAEVVRAQIYDVLSDIDLEKVKPIIAYEPVWAISHGGAGVACSGDIAKDMLKIIRSMPGIASAPVLYGGSVTAEHVHEYVGGHDGFDGVLVGHSATSASGFDALLSSLSF